MKAITSCSDNHKLLEIRELPEPIPNSNEALVAVTAFSLNRGELRRAQSAEPGTPIGWDLSGVVEEPAKDGTGPKRETRVVGFSRNMCGWAERVALPTRDLANIPDPISDEDASTLPVAGLTALYALERCERLLGSRVLITGASGGVGYFACQLAKLMGAHVTAQIRRDTFIDSVKTTGADDIVVSPDGSNLNDRETFRAIIDGVGGEILTNLLPLLDERGRAVLYGVSSGPSATLSIRELFFTGDGRVEGFHLYRETEIETASKGLTRLLKLLGSHHLKVAVSVEKNWAHIDSVAKQLIQREIPGKAVLHL